MTVVKFPGTVYLEPSPGEARYGNGTGPHQEHTITVSDILVCDFCGSEAWQINQDGGIQCAMHHCKKKRVDIRADKVR